MNMTGSVIVSLDGCAANLLLHLVATLAGQGEAARGAEKQGEVLMRAMALLDLALKAKRDGKRLTLYDPAHDTLSEIAF